MKTLSNAGLAAYPELPSRIPNYFTGINSIVIYYPPAHDRLAAESCKPKARL